MPIQHNVYFNEAVQSIASERHGQKFTVGIITKGTYHFGTDAAERVTVVSGFLKVKLDSIASDDTPSPEWVNYPAGTIFEVPAKSGFDVTAHHDSAYLCEFL